jgi:hypothetical protein
MAVAESQRAVDSALDAVIANSVMVDVSDFTSCEVMAKKTLDAKL